MTGRILEVVGAIGFESPTPWSRTGVSEKSKALRVSHLRASVTPKSCLNWSTVGPQTKRIRKQEVSNVGSAFG